MINYKSMKDLVQLKTPDVLKKHWSNSSSWEMVEALSFVVETDQVDHFNNQLLCDCQ